MNPDAPPPDRLRPYAAGFFWGALFVLSYAWALRLLDRLWAR
jgi:hypothetical protein